MTKQQKQKNQKTSLKVQGKLGGSGVRRGTGRNSSILLEVGKGALGVAGVNINKNIEVLNYTPEIL